MISNNDVILMHGLSRGTIIEFIIKNYEDVYGSEVSEKKVKRMSDDSLCVHFDILARDYTKKLRNGIK